VLHMAQKIVSRQKHNMLSLLHAACLKLLVFFKLLQKRYPYPKINVFVPEDLLTWTTSEPYIESSVTGTLKYSDAPALLLVLRKRNIKTWVVSNGTKSILYFVKKNWHCFKSRNGRNQINRHTFTSIIILVIS